MPCADFLKFASLGLGTTTHWLKRRWSGFTISYLGEVLERLSGKLDAMRAKGVTVRQMREVLACNGSTSHAMWARSQRA